MPQRPIRDAQEKLVEKIPQGPLGFVGGGNAIGAGQFFLVSTINRFNPISGIKAGYKIVSHSVDRSADETKHTFEINSYSKDVAKFVARTQAAPSTADLLAHDVRVTSIRKVEERRTATTWKVVAVVKSRGKNTTSV